MNSAQDLLAELYEMRFPDGIPWDDIAIHAEVTEYAAYIIGSTSRYLNGKKLDPERIKINERLSQRIDYSVQVLTELRDFKKRHDELVKAIIDALSTQSL